MLALIIKYSRHFFLKSRYSDNSFNDNINRFQKFLTRFICLIISNAHVGAIYARSKTRKTRVRMGDERAAKVLNALERRRDVPAI